jgi:hypothetical protein
VTGMAAVVDELLVDDIVDSPDVARVTGATPRSVTRWLEGASPRRPCCERIQLDSGCGVPTPISTTRSHSTSSSGANTGG